MQRQSINDPERFVDEALEGMEMTFPTLLEYDRAKGIVTRRARARDKVGIVSGGGAGHEPLHVGFVGQGSCNPSRAVFGVVELGSAATEHRTGGTGHGT